MKKTTVEDTNSISIYWLNQHGYLDKNCSYISGGIKWTRWGSESSIGFSMNRDNWGTPYERTYIRFQYNNIPRYSDEKEGVDYRVYLTSTPCNYGGKRYWFICPGLINNIACNRRVGVLYSAGKYFLCRHCGSLIYEQQTKSGVYRGSTVSIPQIERAREEAKRITYKGKYTRKYRRYLRLSDNFERDLIAVAAYLDRKK